MRPPDPQRGPHGGPGDRRCAGCGAALATDNTARLCGKCHREQRDQLRTPAAHKDEFFETEELRAAFGSQHMGKVLKAYRHHPHHLQVFGKALNQELLGRWLGLTQAQVSKLENGRPEQNLETLQNYARILRLPQDLLWFDLPGQSRVEARKIKSAGLVLLGSSNSPTDPTQGESLRLRRAGNVDHALFLSAERLQEDLTNTLAIGYLGSASADEFEEQVLRLGEATRYESPETLLGDLIARVTEIRGLLLHTNAKDRRRRYTHILSQLAGLMSLTLLKLSNMPGARNWVRTAEILAAETGDAHLQSWTYAQEAYFHFYAANLRGTINAAQRAQRIAATGVGGVLAAAVEARAHALLGRQDATFDAVNRAESLLEQLDSGLLIPSAFGYDEAQLRFHQGNALTHLKATRQASAVHEQALALYPEDDYLDRALVHLDQASCYIHDGDATSAADLTARVLNGLSDSQAHGIITARARDILDTMPSAVFTSPAANDLRELFADLDK